MQLERIRIQNYKCLKDVTAVFRAPAEKDALSVHLLVGVNGSGKSCFLEALGMIFTRIIQGEVPGFPFFLEYRVRKGRVEVSPADTGNKLKVTITSGGRTQELDQVPEAYLPRRIVACSSGANHLMESVLLTLPRASLASSLYDLSLREDPNREEEMERLLDQYQKLDTNPWVFSLDGATARLVVPVLFAIVPDAGDQAAAESYFQLREKLLRSISGGLSPVAFSLVVDKTKLKGLLQSRANSPQYGLLAKLFRAEQPDGSGPLHSWIVNRAIPSPETGSEDGEARISQTAVFCYEPWPGRKSRDRMWNSRLSKEFGGDPMMLLNVLLAAHRSGVLQEIQLAFHSGESSTLLGLETLSDGELMWLARMGLVLMSRQTESAETLFLFDEPDVHFNNEWNMNFIETLRLCSEAPSENLEHGFVIATHSTLLLTDAYPEQINLFSAKEGGEIQVEETPVSPFAAQQDELARLLFSASPVGRYALQRVERLMKQARRPEEILDLIRQTGPGYQRFRLYERYYELKKEQEQ